MKFKNHKYVYTISSYSNNHHFELIGPKGAVEYNANVQKDENELRKYGPTCGLEFHHYDPPDYMKNQAPTSIKCDLTGGKCWSDGTSLYAKELWSRFELYLESREYEYIFTSLENEYERVSEGKE